MFAAASLASCNAGASEDAAAACLELPGQVVRELDWSTDGSRIALLGSTGDGEWIVGTVDPVGPRYVELARSGDILSGVTARGDGVLWQQSSDERASLVLGAESKAATEWSLSTEGFLALEATDERLLAADVVNVAAGGDEVDVVEVSLGPSSAVTSRIATFRGIESLAATRDGATIAVGGQQVVAGPMVVNVVGEVTWKQAFETGWPVGIAIDATGQMVLIQDATTSSLLWLKADGSTAPTPAGGRAVLAFDLSNDGTIAYSTHPNGKTAVCILRS